MARTGYSPAASSSRLISPTSMKPAASADRGPARDPDREIDRQAPGAPLDAGQQQLDAADGEEYRHRVVEADSTSSTLRTRGLMSSPCRLSRKNTAAASVEPTIEPIRKLSVQPSPSNQLRRDAGQRRGDGDTDGRQQQRRPGGRAEVAEFGAQPAVEQDDGERDAAYDVGGEVVVEEDPARPVLAEEHAEPEEHEQQWRADPGRDQTDEDAEEQQEGSQQDQLIAKLHRALAAWTGMPVTLGRSISRSAARPDRPKRHRRLHASTALEPASSCGSRAPRRRLSLPLRRFTSRPACLSLAWTAAREAEMATLIKGGRIVTAEGDYPGRHPDRGRQGQDDRPGSAGGRAASRCTTRGGSW